MHRETDEEVEARWFQLGVRIREWALEEKLPDPTYDPEDGWKLDQFAMHFEPELLKEIKNQLGKIDNTELEETFPDVEALKKRAELGSKIQALLLSKKFRVTGCLPHSTTAEEIPHSLLEIFYPVIEISALHERRAVLANVQRRYELVRVFRLEGAPGRKAGYDWRKLFEMIESKGHTFDSIPKLVNFCRQNVLRISGEKPEKPAADATTREAILKLGMEKFVKKKKPGNQNPG